MAKEYISREAAIKVAATVKVLGLPQWNSAVGYTMEKLQSIPAADVVEVVRCADCRYAYDTVCGWCCSHGICVDCIVRENFFCADGERKDGGQDDV